MVGTETVLSPPEEIISCSYYSVVLAGYCLQTQISTTESSCCDNTGSLEGINGEAQVGVALVINEVINVSTGL